MEANKERVKVLLKLQPSIYKLLERIKLWEKGVAESVEIHACAAELQEAIRDATQELKGRDGHE